MHFSARLNTHDMGMRIYTKEPREILAKEV